ncbi:MAG: ATP-binding protein [Chloroflexota bacterium]
MIQPSILSTMQPNSDLPIMNYPDKLVLIIEPEGTRRIEFETTLSQAGYHTRAFSRVADAITDFERAHIDVVIICCDLPYEGGLQFLDYVKQNFQKTDVILTAKSASVDILTQALRSGASDYLVNPDPKTDLLAAVARVVKQQNENADSNPAPEPLAELEIFRATSELFLKNLSQEEVLSIIGDRALQMSHADYCEIFTPRPEDGNTFISMMRLPEKKIFSPDTHRLSEKLAKEVLESQQALAINQVREETAQLASWLILPLRVSGNIVGILSLGDAQNRAFSPAIIKLLSIFVDQASIAMNNAQLFTDLSEAYNNLAQSRTQILQSKNTLQTLFDGITDGLYIVDAELKIIMVNQAEIDHLALPPYKALNQYFGDLGWADIAPGFIEQVSQTFQTAKRSHWVPSDILQSPLVKNREMHLYPILSPQQTVQQVIILAQDVTSQKQLQATLFQSASLTALGQLATSIAHEVNNPLTIALTNTQLTMFELDPADEIHEMMEDTYYACNRIKEIVGNLVDFSNQEIYQFSEINLIETIEETIALISHPLRKAKIDLERAYHHTPTIIASRSHLKMIWMNILMNACDAISATGEAGKITIKVDEVEQDQVQISIFDTGIGIRAEHYNNIFTPFFTTKPIGQGVGLGLFTTRTIIEKHNGKITFDSEGEGTQFTTVLPKELAMLPLV